jgi:hypothetical protein
MIAIPATLEEVPMPALAAVERPWAGANGYGTAYTTFKTAKVGIPEGVDELVDIPVVRPVSGGTDIGVS